jgi:hypothetical protein
MKHCKVCNEELIIDKNFTEYNKKNYNWKCNSCYKSYIKQNLLSRPLSVYKNNIKKRYNIDIDTYEQMYKAQNGCCKICNTEFPIHEKKKRLFIDHCHKTEKVRGLLCHGCNAAIGFMKDDVNILTKAIEYLKGK